VLLTPLKLLEQEGNQRMKMTKLTRNINDKVLIKPVKTVNGKWHNCIGEIVSIHPASGCYVVLINESQLVFFEDELAEISTELKS